MDFTFRDDSLNARNAFQSTKGPEQTQQYNVQPERHAAQGPDVVLAVGGRRVALRLGQHLRRAARTGRAHAPIRRPSDRINFNVRVDHALNKAHTLRAIVPAERQRPAKPRRRQLRSAGSRVRARRPTSILFACRRADRWRGSWFAESRLQLRWRANDIAVGVRGCRRSACSTRSRRAARSRPADAAAPKSNTPPTSTRRKRGHALRIGTLVEGGWYRSDSRTNYLGTFTFASLADYDAGRPSTFTARVGESARRVLAVAGGRSTCRTTGARGRT